MSGEHETGSKAEPMPEGRWVEVRLTEEDMKKVDEIVNARRGRFGLRFDLDPEYLRAFGAMRAGPFVIGSVPGVSDASARTTDFPPTLYELEVLARYYARELVSIETAYEEEGVSGSYECRMHSFANLRLNHLAE